MQCQEEDLATLYDDLLSYYIDESELSTAHSTLEMGLLAPVTVDSSSNFRW